MVWPLVVAVVVLVGGVDRLGDLFLDMAVIFLFLSCSLNEREGPLNQMRGENANRDG